MIFPELTLARSQTRFQEIVTRGTRNIQCIFTRGGDYECRKRVWSSCDCRMWPFSSAGDTHVHKALSLSHTPDTAQAHVTFVCELRSRSYTGAASAHTHTHTHTHTHKLPGHQSTLHSVLTRVRRGIKEALRAKQKTRHVFSQGEKAQETREPFASDDSESLRGNAHRMTPWTIQGHCLHFRYVTFLNLTAGTCRAE